MTTAIQGVHATYDVGPGRQFEDPDGVPWGALTAGDVVNIYHRAEPYGWKLCLRGRGTAAAPIVVNGVTNASGDRPRFDFAGARTASGCNPGAGADIFETGSVWSLEDYGGIVVRPGVDEEWGYRPGWIVIRNLELYGAMPGATFTNLADEVAPYSDAPAAIWIQPSTDVVLQNNVIRDSAFGVFTMAKDNTLDQACERITLRSNRIYGNGISGSDQEHNVYMQAANPVVEGNFFGRVREGSLGASYKSRSSGEIFRYNYVEASARAIDWVEAEEQSCGVGARPDYGVDYAYGNIVVNDCPTETLCATNPIHYGGDNYGAQDDAANLFTPAIPYRSHLYFFNNTVVNRADSAQNGRTAMFDLSARGTRVDAWNNVFYASGTAQHQWLRWSGDLRLHGTNLAFGIAADAREDALEANFTIQVIGTLLTDDPFFADAANLDFRLGSGSPAIGAGTAVPPNLSPAEAYVDTPVNLQPVPGANGIAVRTASDLGALETE